MVSLRAAARGPLRCTRAKLRLKPRYMKSPMTRGETRNRPISACTQGLLSPRPWLSLGGFGESLDLVSLKGQTYWKRSSPSKAARGCPVTPMMSSSGSAPIIGHEYFILQETRSTWDMWTNQIIFNIQMLCFVKLHTNEIFNSTKNCSLFFPSPKTCWKIFYITGMTAKSW